MTGDGMCGVFIPDRVLAGWWRSQWKVETPISVDVSVTSTEMEISTSADPANHCYTNSTKGDNHPVHYSDPTRTRTYIPAPFHNLLCTYPPTSGHSPSIGSSTSLPEPCQV